MTPLDAERPAAEFFILQQVLGVSGASGEEVRQLFGVQLDARTLSADLRINGTDYTLWTDADVRIVRRKQLAADFDTRLTEYFERKRAEVLRGIAE